MKYEHVTLVKHEATWGTFWFLHSRTWNKNGTWVEYELELTEEQGLKEAERLTQRGAEKEQGVRFPEQTIWDLFKQDT